MLARRLLRTPAFKSVPIASSGRQASQVPFFRTASTLPKLPIFEAIASHDPRSTAVIHSSSDRRFTYGQLLKDTTDAKDKLRKAAGSESIAGERVAFLAENGYDYVVTLLSILANQSIAVPLSQGFPAHELRYIINNSEALMLLSTEKFHDKSQEVVKGELHKRLMVSTIEKRLASNTSSKNVELEALGDDNGGLMLYTSGTTSRPKGVLLPQSVLTAQCQSLHEAWDYRPKDHLLHVLPLHHIHGTINALLTPLFAGSTIEFLFPFNTDNVWQRLAAPFLRTDRSPKEKITFFTVVPTIYNRLLSSHAQLSPELKQATKEATSPHNLRLNISGSAALPTPTKAAWTKLSEGNVLLERYGMTEVGMALSCGLDFADRVDGSVGWPLPSVEARLVDTETHKVIQPREETDKDGREREGEIQLRGPTVFKEYWRNARATREDFIEGEDGKGQWFKTGDVASRREVRGAGKGGQAWANGPMYFIRGRKSVDFIKTGGEKVSALEVERELLSLPQVAEAAVVGLSSEQWGQRVAAVIVLNPEQSQSGRGGKKWGAMDMRRALKDKLAKYKIPQEIKVVEDVPKNAMGKVNKKSLVKELFEESS
ncbi:MAG: hypothetical protein M1835_007160 [Candelina submexicana]|nr:MAG: hypothetical protein M1835_007160 [Candelina submexicana]